MFTLFDKGDMLEKVCDVRKSITLNMAIEKLIDREPVIREEPSQSPKKCTRVKTNDRQDCCRKGTIFGVFW